MLAIDKLNDILSDHFAVDKNKILLNSNLIEDFQADELDLVEIGMAIEEEYDITGIDMDSSNIKTVNDIVDYLGGLVIQQQLQQLRGINRKRISENRLIDEPFECSMK